MKKFVALAVTSMVAFSTMANAAELSDWAASDYEIANGTGLIPYSIASVKLNDNITRQELCEMIMNLYKTLNGAPAALVECPFTDTDNESVKEAYAIGIVSGKTETEFMPDETVTRQEIAKLVIKTVECAGYDAHITVGELEDLCDFEDFGDSQQWASADLAKAVKYKIISGVSETQLCPENTVTREQAISIVNRAFNAFSEGQISYQQPQFTDLYEGMAFDGDTVCSWCSIADADNYVIIIKDADGNYVKSLSTKKTTAKIEVDGLDYNKNYTIIVGAEIGDYVTVFSDPISVHYGLNNSEEVLNLDSSLLEKYKRVFPTGSPFTTEAEASYNMTTVSFPVWKMKDNGEKYSSTMSLTVNRNLADEVVQIFNEIYMSSEQFPIKNVGGYCWRSTPLGGTSQHSYGTCIDINYNENYYCYANSGKAITGSFWKPGENPFSIPENGSVVKSFAKYGWKWGGNAWTTLHDYMHFTYLGN